MSIDLHLRHKVDTVASLVRAAGYRRRRRFVLSDRVRIYGKPTIALCKDSVLELGSRTHLVSRSRNTALGLSHPVIIRTLSTGATIRIGADVGLSGTSICCVNAVSVGDRCLVGANVVIADTDFHPVDIVARRYQPIPPRNEAHAITIGSDVFIGANSVVLKGVRIGDGAVIGAGSIVARDIPAMAIAAGNPAVVIGTVGSRRGGHAE